MTKTNDKQPAIHPPAELVTSRFILKRSLDQRDKPELLAHIKEGGSREFTIWSGIVPPFNPDDFIAHELERFSFETCNEYVCRVTYSIFAKHDLKMLGYVGVCLIFDDDCPVGFDCYVFCEARGHHVGEEASRALLKAYFQGVLMDEPKTSLNAWAGTKNKAAQGFLAKLGFTDPTPDLRRYFGDDDVGDEDDDDPIGALYDFVLDAGNFEASETSSPRTVDDLTRSPMASISSSAS